ncbi:hypothetical protein [Thermotoga sp. KOL6]|uniref:hypothetical protein n=1 Tax=Thermotoga sp. KOL6 TaxID=126741 RepID=UPI000CC9D84A|nr:hypothetical protein [Thermotoga sp. KOL6]PLV60244.1 hypothetical protein AS005_02840 [Thermotoga sp. KOL6]
MRYLTQLLSVLLILIGFAGMLGLMVFYLFSPYLQSLFSISFPEILPLVLLMWFLPFFCSGVLLNYYVSSGSKWLVVVGFLVLFPSFVSQVYGLYSLWNILSKFSLFYFLSLFFTMISLAFFLTIVRRG